jgi:hypothetical protein
MDSDSSYKKRRRAFTDLERRNIRARNRTHPGPQQHLISWIKETTGRTVNQSSISEILSPKFDYLDNPLHKSKHLGSQRHYHGDWPDLEHALFEWQQRMQHKKAIITGDILKSKAQELWKALPQYKEEPMPTWSNGWLSGFKKRHNIKEYVSHGEGTSAEINAPERMEQMEAVRQECQAYLPQDIYNMDETGNCWKMLPNRTLATESSSGSKKAKDRVTLALTTNGDGSHKLDPWLIGRFKNPRCFKNVNRQALGIHYRFNKTKWMTAVICLEFLQWFDQQMRRRKVLLLMDNFSGHELAIQLAGGVDSLQNTKVVWLPKNTTSYWQPLDQGIIATFKLFYRKHWISYILKEYEADRDPNKTVTLLHAIRWSVDAWHNSVTSSTIQKCWWKSTCIKKPLNVDNTGIDEERIDEEWISQEKTQLSRQILAIPNILNPLSIDEFIQPPEEEIIDSDENITESIIEQYSQDNAEESMDEAIEVSLVSKNDAIKALELLKLYEIQQEDGDQANVKILNKMTHRINRQRQQEQKQVGIEAYFKGH